MDARVATLLFDLLTLEEEEIDSATAELRFEILLLTDRLVAVTSWTRAHPHLQDLNVGYFGASAGAAAALAAAACTPGIGAIISRDGRPDLAGAALTEVTAPTLPIVGSHDHEVLALNRGALAKLSCESDWRACRERRTYLSNPAP